MPKESSPRWLQSQVDEWIAWHEARMKELNYPPELVAELRHDRTKWFAAVKRVK